MFSLKTIAISAIVSLLVSLTVLGVGLIGNQSDEGSLGAVVGTTRFPNSSVDAQSLKVNGTTVVSYSGATTSATVGCIQTAATSTSQTIKLLFNTSGAGTTTVNGTASGDVFWTYGTCP